MNNTILSFSKYPKNKLIILFVLLLIFLVLIAIFIFQKNKKNQETAQHPSTPSKPIPTKSIISPQTTALFPPEQKIAQVGEEIIYGKDANYIVNKRYAVDIVTRIGIDEVKKRALEDAEQDSILLQEGSKASETELSPSIFNNPNKNNDIRQKIVDDFKSKQLENEEKISGALISVWYHNVRLPSIPLAEAKTLASQKITKIYNDLKAGRITFPQAGDILKNDTSLSKIDISYKDNAYFEFNDHPKSQKSIVYDELEKRLWQLDEGQMSEIIQYPDPSIPLGSNEEEFFGIIKVYKLTNKGNGSYSDWLNGEKQKYAISVF